LTIRSQRTPRGKDAMYEGVVKRFRRIGGMANLSL
jgi:hypothetical protein